MKMIYMFLILVTKINFFYKYELYVPVIKINFFYKNYCTHHFQPFETCVVPQLTQSENLIQVIVPSERE